MRGGRTEEGREGGKREGKGRRGRGTMTRDPALISAKFTDRSIDGARQTYKDR